MISIWCIWRIWSVPAKNRSGSVQGQDTTDFLSWSGFPWTPVFLSRDPSQICLCPPEGGSVTRSDRFHHGFSRFCYQDHSRHQLCGSRNDPGGRSAMSDAFQPLPNCLLLPVWILLYTSPETLMPAIQKCPNAVLPPCAMHLSARHIMLSKIPGHSKSCTIQSGHREEDITVHLAIAQVNSSGSFIKCWLMRSLLTWNNSLTIMFFKKVPLKGFIKVTLFSVKIFLLFAKFFLTFHSWSPLQIILLWYVLSLFIECNNLFNSFYYFLNIFVCHPII